MNTYEQRRASFTVEERRLARISFRLSLLRGGLFLGFAASLITVLATASSRDIRWWIAAAAFFVAFLMVLPVHDRILGQQRRAADLVAINDEALHRIARDWDRVPLPAVSEHGVDGPLARDLGLFGRASLFHLLGTAHTPPGKARLASWLLAPAAPEEIALRQKAVAELAPELDLRQQLQVRARPMEKLPPDCETFLRWAEDRPWLLGRTGLLWLTRVLPIFTMAALPFAITALFFGGGGISWPFLLLFAFNFFLSSRYQEKFTDSFDRLQAREDELQLYSAALAAVVEKPLTTPLLQRIAADLAPQGKTAAEWMTLLHKRVVLSDARHSTPLHFFLQNLLLWDFHTLWLLERWQQAAGPHVRRWLTALGEFEALCALAGLRYDHPGWCVPEVAAGQDRYTARGLGHPLIPEARRVTNDVEVGPPGTFLLVTGSNMSGKSTLLRSIGINAVLAQAGAPACAEDLRLPPLDLATSILIEDSLADGVSFFMAELQRVKKIVEASDRSHAEGRVLLYLLDEVLRGTNSEERQVAVRRVLLHLLHQRAIGAVSTHDLQLAEIEELQAASCPVHFRETLHPGGDGPPMTFDYKMHPGVATTVNALKLMELVGLTPEDEGS
jgi:MutS domain V